jgi:hypothetical protein
MGEENMSGRRHDEVKEPFKIQIVLESCILSVVCVRSLSLTGRGC